MKQENKTTKKFWPKLWELLTPSHRQLKTAVFFVILVEIFKLSGPYVLKLIIDDIGDIDNVILVQIIYLAGLYFVAIQLTAFIENFGNRRARKTIIEIENYIPIRAHQKLLSLPLAYHEKENTGSKIYKIVNGVDKISELIGSMIWDVIPVLFQFVITLIIFFILDYRLALSLLFIVPVFIYMTYRLNVRIYPMRKKRMKKYEESGGYITQSMVNINSVQSFVQEEQESQKFKDTESQILSWYLSEIKILFDNFLVRGIIIDVGRFLVIIIGAYFAYEKIISVGDFVFAITLSEKTYLSLSRLTRFYDNMQNAAIAAKRLTDILDEETVIKNPQKGIKPRKIIGEIEFKHVSYKYNSSENFALENVNVKINSGCVTALVGPSGGGKTTLARMIYRHYDPQVGKVLLDGKDLNKYDLYAFRRYLAIVPQEVEIFDGSIKSNIAYARTDADDEEIEAAARIANAEEFILKLPEKYEATVGERGIKLSGGQRQRIGIARAILANPSVLIFDEATSSLDSLSERLIQDSMEKISRNRTMIIIAHRLSTIKKADKIIVLEGGRIVETGSHFELAKNNGGLYAKLIRLQEVGEVG